MEITLKVVQSPALPAAVLTAFAEKAKALGQTADERLAQLLTSDVAQPRGTGLPDSKQQEVAAHG